jgi:hypothetical protein
MVIRRLSQLQKQLLKVRNPSSPREVRGGMRYQRNA